MLVSLIILYIVLLKRLSNLINLVVDHDFWKRSQLSDEGPKLLVISFHDCWWSHSIGWS